MILVLTAVSVYEHSLNLNDFPLFRRFDHFGMRLFLVAISICRSSEFHATETARGLYTAVNGLDVIIQIFGGEIALFALGALISNSFVNPEQMGLHLLLGVEDFRALGAMNLVNLSDVLMSFSRVKGKSALVDELAVAQRALELARCLVYGDDMNRQINDPLATMGALFVNVFLFLFFMSVTRVLVQNAGGSIGRGAIFPIANEVPVTYLFRMSLLCVKGALFFSQVRSSAKAAMEALAQVDPLVMGLHLLMTDELLWARAIDADDQLLFVFQLVVNEL